MTDRLLAEEALAFPLSFGQQRLWLLDRLLTDRAAYNVPTFLELRGPLSVAALAAAFAQVVARHEVLRTTFAELAGEPVQVVGEPFAPPLPVVDLAALPAARRAAEAALLAAGEAGRPFDLAAGPLLRLTLLRLGAEEHHLLLDLHHIVCDEWSMGVLVREVGAAYLGRPLPELPLQYADFAVWQREEGEEAMAADLAFWRGELSGAPTLLDLPLDRPRSAGPSLAADAVPFAVDPRVSAGLKAWAAEAQGSPFMLLAAVFGALLSRYSGQGDLLLGAPAAYRHRGELEGLVGFFLNTLVLRLRPRPESSWEAYFAAVRAAVLAAFAHQEVPFERLVAEVAGGRGESALPLVQVLFSFEGAAPAPPELPGLALAPLDLPGASAKFELNLNAGEHGGGFAGALTFWTALFDRPTVARMAGQLQALLAGVARDPRRRLGELPLLGPAEHHQLLQEWNDTAEPFAEAAPLDELFLRQAALWPDGVAVVFEEEQISYGGLEARSRRWAGWLAARGVGLETRVGVALGRSAELPALLLGILRAGGAYVPLDPDQPAGRLADLTADAAPVLVVGGRDMRDFANPQGGADVEGFEDREGAGLERLAAVIYTSGSTGRPKGVMVPHAGLVNRLLWSRRTYPVGPGDRVLQKAPILFDLSVWEIFGPLVAGGTVVLLPPGDHLLADRVAAALERHAITLLHSVPSLLAALLAEPALLRCRSLRWLFAGGEALPTALRDRIVALLPAVRMHNQYGPTEASIDVTFGTVGDPDPSFRSASLGRPMANTRLYVVDSAGGPVPTGGLGELWIGGANVTRGYWRRPERTAESFVPDPFGGAPGGRLYRTGDRVRRLADGRLEYAGRLDGQVKVRGVRIELGEIEAALAALPEVREAAAAVHDGAAGPRLVGYVVPAGRAAEGEGLRRALRERLPEALIPSLFVEMAALPRTPSGKLDRKALPAPAAAPEGEGPRPEGAVEEALAAIWAEVLKLPEPSRLGAEESFFALGGHSLLAALVVSRVRERLGQEIPLARLFEHPTIRGLASWIEERAAPAPAAPLPPRPPGLSVFPLSFGQERLWLLDRLLADRSIYNVPVALEVRGPLSAGALAAAFAGVVARHEILRTTFAVHDGQGAQVVDAGPFPAMGLADLSGLPGETAGREAGRLAAEDARRPFDLERGPVLRSTLVRLAASHHHLLLTLHHIASDEWSMALLVDEIAALYRAATGGPPALLAPLSAQYADFALWQRGAVDEIEEQLAFWRERLEGAPTQLELPADRPWPAVASFQAEAVALELPEALSARLDAQAAGARATPFMLLLAGYGALLSRYTGQRDLLVGTPVARRHRRELEGVAGFFLNTLPLRFRLDPEISWERLVGEVRETAVAAFAHQDVPFERLVAELAPGRDLAVSPLVQSLFVFTSTPTVLPAIPGLTLEPLATPGASAKFELNLHLGLAEGRIGGALSYWTDLFDRPTAERLAGHLERLLAAAADDPARPVADLAGISPAERHQLLAEWNDSDDGEPAAACLDELIERRAGNAPDAVAAVFEGEHLSYGDLWQRSAEAAGELGRRGVGLEVRVGLAYERSLATLVGTVAVLAAGGAAVFLDPRQPAERRAELASDAGVELTLPGGETARRKSGPASLPRGPRSPDGLAAILYTSGSTGRPKGVMLSHRGLAHRLLGTRGTAPPAPGDRVLHKAPATFDISHWETLGPLHFGATVVIARPGGHTDTAYLADLVVRERVTLAHFIPSILKLFLDEPGLGAGTDLRAVFAGGEALPFALRDRAAALLPAAIYDQYGPTEASIDVSSGPVRGSDRGAFRAVPIGRPLGSARLYVADAALRLAPPGALGELLIGGPYLARGYGLDAPRTAERFVPDPFGETAGGRLYRTGDRARHLTDGRIEYAGRIDRQVKVRGVRIEPGEIEAALAALPGVREAAVVVRNAPNGEALLAAYFAPPVPGGMTPEALRDALRRRLPEALVPAVWVGLAELPRTASGKLDRNALPPLAADVEDARPLEGAIEPTLARIWQGLLRVERVGAGDDFFSLGGHSLLALRLTFLVREAFGVELPATAVFEEPVLADLAARIGRALDRREMPPEERRQVLAASRARRAGTGIRSLAELFVEQAKRSPAAPALTFEGGHVSYGEVEARSRRLAGHLLRLGVRPDTPVALFCERTPELLVALLAVLRAGAAYVPLDPQLPEERLRHLLDDCRAPLLLRGPGTRLPEGLAAGEGRTGVLDLAALEPTLADGGPELPRNLDPALAAYWIYTSGSTGNPKPVAVPHAQVARLMTSSEELFGFGPGDVWTLFHSYAFDFSVWEIWGALAYGGRLVIVPYLVSRSPEDFARLLDEQGVTVLNQTPSAFYQLASQEEQRQERVGKSLSWVIFGGEPLEVRRLAGWWERRAGSPEGRPRLVNMYGITETTVHVTFGEVVPGEARGAGTAIGRPLPDLSLYVLDEAGEPCPREVTGELAVGGAGLARGYAGRPALTAERFVPDPYGGEAGARLYRSGDLGRLLVDGTYEHWGRADRQLKIRGFRIEPGEIEAALTAHPSLSQAAVVVRDGRLVAYAVARSEAAVPGGDTLRAFLAARLPGHMVPEQFVPLPRLPLTPNGKLDTRALPAPGVERFLDAPYEAPGTATEKALAEIWRDLLRVDRVGTGDDFFGLGGHSLLALQMDWRIREALGVELPLTTLFADSTLAGLARRIESALAKGEHAPAAPLARLARRDGAPLSFAQQRLWFLDRLHPGTSAYNLPYALRIRGPFEPAVLARTLAALVARHEPLRTTFEPRAESAVQVIAPVLVPAAPRVDLAGLPRPAAEAEILCLARQEAARPFDLARGPLLRATVLALGPEDFALLFAQHHIVSDAWSMGLLLGEITALYTALARGLPSPLPELPVQYADFAADQRSWLDKPAGRRQLAYWRGRLQGLEPLDLPADRPHPPVRSFRGGLARRSLAPRAVEAVASLAGRLSSTPFSPLAGVFAVLLARLARRGDLALGTVVSGRTRPETREMIGFFVNTLVLRSRVDLGASLEAGVEAFHATVREAFEHQELPFERLVEELAPERNLARAPLTDVMFSYHTPADGRLAIPGLELTQIPLAATTAKLELTLHAAGGETAVDLLLEYSADRYDEATAERWLALYEGLLLGFAEAPETPAGELAWLGEAERAQVLAAGAVRNDPREVPSLADLFERQAGRRPDAPALGFAGHHLTYGELERGSRLLAAWLVGRSEPGVPVALFCERTPEMVVALLAVLRGGRAYVPLDPRLPEERLRYLLDDCGADLVLQGPGTELPDGLRRGRTVVALARLEARFPLPAAPLPRVDPQATAYWIYTSGSTGNPKPVAVSQAQVSRLLSSSEDLFGFGPGDVWTLFHSYAFDFSVWEIWGALAYGGRLVPVPWLESRSPAALARILDEERVTVLDQTPSAFYQLLAHEEQAGRPVGESLAWVIFGGEPLEEKRLSGWWERRRKGAGTALPRLVNMYGITETTVHVTFHPLVPASPDARGTGRGLGTAIGRPLADLSLYVLDPTGEPCPLGVPGELAVGGAGLALGYPGRADLTAARFVPDPFGGVPGARLYRSGDLGQLLADGGFEHWGRVDRQLKMRGFRIEPGEIEAAVTGHPEVAAAAVVLRGDRLVAYFVPRGGSPLPPADLRGHLAARLPAHMVPASFVPLPRLPLTANGKLDTAALPEPAGDLPGLGSPYEAPRSPAENALAAIWSELLGVERIGRQDDFFALGGHSLLALRADWRIRESLGVGLPLAALFERSTLADLAGRVERALEEAPEAPEAPFPRLARQPGAPVEAPLSPSQQRLWFLHQLDPADPSYHMPFALRLTGPLDRGALAGALAEIVRRHEVLRTVYAAGDEGPRQRVLAGAAPLLPLVDLAGLPPSRREGEAAAVLGEAASRPFDLAARPPLRTALVALGDRDHLAALTLHHIAGDAWSLGVLVRELATLYAAALAGTPSPLPELPAQYAEFALWQNARLSGEPLARLLFYWRGRLAGAPAVHSLPLDRPRPPGGHGPGDGRSLSLGEAAAARLQEVGREHGATPFMVVLAAWQALLARWGGEPDLVVGTPIAERARPEVADLIGFFVNNLALRADLAARGAEASFADFLAEVRRATLGAFAHRDLPFERLVEELAPERGRHHQPVFQISFTLDGPAVPAPELPGLAVVPWGMGGAPAKYDLDLAATLDGGLGLSLAFDTALFEGATVERQLGRLARLLEGALADPQAPLAALDLLTPEEQEQLRANGEAPAPAGSLLALFARRAEGAPDALAAVDPEGALSYGELSRRAARLAAGLAARIAAETPVGVLLPPTIELVTAFWGVLAAGGAYLPLDPQSPPGRLEEMRRAAGAPLVLTSPAWRSLLPAAAPAVTLAGLAAEAGPAGPDFPLRAGPVDHGAALAWIVFTSGSTGTPKPVGVPREAAAFHLTTAVEHLGLTPGDRALATASPAFDVTFEQTVPILLAGGTLLLRGAAPLDPVALTGELAASRATVMDLPTAVLAPWLAAAEPHAGDLALRLVSAGGEGMPVPVARRHLAGPLGAVPLLNAYGPTEATVSATFLPVAPRDLEGGAPEVPVGRPLPGRRAYVLDERGRPVPPGFPGELALGGRGLARGYLGRPAETALAFVPDPFAGPDRPGARLYRTGDRARLLPDGRLELLGRLDRQVKLRGFRIEPGEIEAALLAHEGVREAAVAALPSANGELQLAAYLVPRVEELDAAALRAYLGGRLPPALVPATFTSLPALPRTSRGKLDRRALPAPSPAAGAAAAPASPTEVALAEVWREVLGVSRLGREDSFFALGGHSLLATRLVFRLRERFGVELPLADVFDHPTLAELAARLDALAPSGAPPAGPEPAPAAGPAPPSPAADGSFAVVAIPRGRHRVKAVDLDPRS